MTGVEASIIIPAWNKWEYTRNCLNALIETTPLEKVEIIVVDNGSSDETKTELKKFSSKINPLKIIRNEENLGFAKACNQGGNSASGEYLVFLNNDTLTKQGWLEQLLKASKSDPTIGGVGSLLLYPNGSVQHGGVGLFHGQTCEINGETFGPLSLPHLLGREKTPETLLKKENQVVPALIAACLLVSKKHFLEIQGFDENFKNGFEDVDFCFRLREKGLKTVICPSSVITHFESTTPKPNNFEQENLRRFLSKWQPYLMGKIEIIDTAAFDQAPLSETIWLDVTGVYLYQPNLYKNSLNILGKTGRKIVPVVWGASPLPDLKIVIKIFGLKISLALPFAQEYGFFKITSDLRKYLGFKERKIQYIPFISLTISQTSGFKKNFLVTFSRMILQVLFKFSPQLKPEAIPPKEKFFIASILSTQ